MEKRRKEDLSPRRREYEQTEEELGVLRNEKGEINKHYGEELKTHSDLVSELKEGVEYQFKKERDELVEAQENELGPLEEKEKSFVAKLRRLYNRDRNEAYAHDHYLNYVKALRVLEEELRDVRKVKKEMSGTRRYSDALEIINELHSTVDDMRELLSHLQSKGAIDEYEERRLREICMKFIELDIALDKLKHQKVYTGRFYRK